MRLLVTGGPAFACGVVGVGGEVVVEVRSETRNQRGEIVQNLTARLLVPRRPATLRRVPTLEFHR